MCVYQSMSTHVFVVDIEECMAKLHYSRFSDTIWTEEESADDIELTAAEVDLFADIGVEARNVYDISVIKNNPNLKLG